MGPPGEFSPDQESLGDWRFRFGRIGKKPELSTMPVQLHLPVLNQRQLTRLHSVEEALATLVACHLVVPPIALVSITGSSKQRCQGTAWAETALNATNDTEPMRALVQNGSCVAAWTSDALRDSVVYLDVNAPQESYVSVTAAHAAIEIRNMTGPVDISSAHGAILVRNCSGLVTVHGGLGSKAYWYGNSGSVDVRADLGIDLYLAQPCAADIVASAVGPISLIVPKGFSSEIEVAVSSQAQVLNDAPKVPIRFVDWAAMRSANATVRLASREGYVRVVETGPDPIA